MKTPLLLKSKTLNCFLTIIFWGLISCSPLVYQVVELKSETSTNSDNSVIFENSDLKVSYNFWSLGGQIGFTIYNKSDKPIYLDWDKTHLIYNGFSYEYWYDIESNSQVSVSKSVSYGAGSSSYSSQSWWGVNAKKTVTNVEKSRPKKILEIPSQSSIYVQKFHLINEPYFTCDFSFDKTPKDLIDVSFEKTNSPIVFRNYITYSLDQKCDSLKVMDNSFYASKISNMDMKVFKGNNKTENKCNYIGTKIEEQTFEYPYYKPNCFFWDTKGK